MNVGKMLVLNWKSGLLLGHVLDGLLIGLKIVELLRVRF